MVADNAAAKAYVDEAEARLRKFHWFDKQGQYSDAADLYKKAANQYKLGKNWNEAGISFRKAGDLNAGPEVQSLSEAARCYIEAHTCLKKVSPQEAIEALKKAISIYVDDGRFKAAATTQMKIAELYEDMVDFEQATTAYSLAAEWFEGEDEVHNYNKCRTKVATYEAQLENYSEAASIFESIATYMAEQKNLHWSCKDYFFKAGVCLMLYDPIAAEKKIPEFVTAYAAFENSNEYKFFGPAVKVLLEEGEEDELADLITVLSRYVRLDDWSVTMLFRIKKTLCADL